MIILQVIHHDERKVQFICVDLKHAALAKEINGHRFNSKDHVVDRLCAICGELDFDATNIGVEFESPVGCTEFYTFWMDG